MNDVKDRYREDAYALACADAESCGIPSDGIVLMMCCKVLENRKYLMAIPAFGIMYEITYNGGKREWYVDRYRKESNAKHAEKEPIGSFARSLAGAVANGQSFPTTASAE
jgi:hypothetical protein